MATKVHIYNDMRTEGNPTSRQVDPYEDLANAIVVRAVDDYRLLRSGRIPTVSEEEQVNMEPERIIKKVLEQKQQIIKFFKSAWYADLTEVSGTYLLDKLNEEAVKRWKPRKHYVIVSSLRLKEEIERRMLGITFLNRLTKVKGKQIRSIVESRKVIIPEERALKICAGLGIPENEFIYMEWR